MFLLKTMQICHCQHLNGLGVEQLCSNCIVPKELFICVHAAYVHFTVVRKGISMWSTYTSSDSGSLQLPYSQFGHF